MLLKMSILGWNGRTGFEPASALPVNQGLTKDGTANSTHDTPEEVLCSRVVEAWTFLPVELQRSIASIVEQYVQLSLGRARAVQANHINAGITKGKV
jgi:hypothetical protein